MQPFYFALLLPAYCLIATRSTLIASISFAANILVVLTWGRIFIINSLKTGISVENISEMVNYIMVFGLEGAFLIFISLSTQMKVSREALIANFQKEEKLKQINNKLKMVNSELKRALESKDEFIFSVSHELRNPLNVILGNLELAMMGTTDQALTVFMENAKSAGELLAFLINNLLDAGKLQTKKLEISPSPTNLRNFIEKFWSVSKLLLQRKNLQGQIYLSRNIPTTLSLDPHRILQILFNLVGNSTKFTSKGGVSIIISWTSKVDFDEKLLESSELIVSELGFGKECHSTEKVLHCEDLEEIFFDNIQSKVTPSDYSFRTRYKSISDLESTKGYDKLNYRMLKFPQVRPLKLNIHRKMNSEPDIGFLKIEVRDTGCGMSKDSVNSLFQKFTQVGNNTSHHQLGSGLGLWISQSLCQSMGGDIKAYSTQCEGSTFVVAIKCKKCMDPIAEDHNYRENRRAMVVDDIKTNRDIYKQFLQECKVTVTDVASNGVESYDVFLNRGKDFFDIIFMDLDMPFLNGEQTCQKIRQHENLQGWKPAMIVIISGNLIEGDSKRLLDPNGSVKANYLFTKPFCFQQCSDLIKGITISVSDGTNDTTTTLLTTDASEQLNDKKTVLLVDDDQLNLRILTTHLDRLKTKAITANNGKEAIDMFLKNKSSIGLILMDAEMPIMSGYEATKRIKKIMKDNRIDMIDIIGLSGNAGTIFNKKCLESGMDSVIQKPMPFSKLQEILRQYKLV
jgi:signal transduction histidine kinase/DNA-binding response OmpR family regulator